MPARQKNELLPRKPAKRRWLNLAAVFLLIILVLAAVLAGLGFGLKIAYAQKFYPGVKIDGQNIGGKTKDEVLKHFNELADNINRNGLIFAAENKEISVNPIIISETDPDLTKTILAFDWQKTMDQAFQIGRQGSLRQRLAQLLRAYLVGADIAVNYNLDEAELISLLKTNFAGLEKPPTNARLEIKAGQAEVIPEQSGYIFDYAKAVSRLKDQLNRLNFDKINLDLVFTESQIKQKDTAMALGSLPRILALDSLKLTASSTAWEIKADEFRPWLEFQLKDKNVVVGLNKDKILAFLGSIAAEIEVPASDATFKVVDNKVTEFQASQDGKTLDLDVAYQKINDQVIAGSAAEISLPIIVKKPQVSIADVNNLGIKELIGRGTSNFKGSPKNRRLNIATGAKTLNGILIKPDEEFSLLAALGAVDGEHGYLQELVIKGARTLPEYGGGLCQIGTTAFRVALNSGLPITQRRNHSYRVVYYEPAGMDATIYDPQPDLKFINDTGNYILFGTKIQGDNLIFEFYGTKDGRQVVIAPNPPKIYNITNPPEPKNIETEDLKPGEKKQVEKPHKGADTYFKSTVTYPSGEIKEKEYYSHYVAWPETWLVGKTPTSTAETAGTENPAPAPAN